MRGATWINSMSPLAYRVGASYVESLTTKVNQPVYGISGLVFLSGVLGWGWCACFEVL